MDDIDTGFSQVALGARCKRLRKQAGKTLASMAEETGLSRGFLSQVENGHTMVSLAALYRIASALETTAPELLTLGEEPTVSIVRSGEGKWASSDQSNPSQLARSLSSSPRKKIEVRECLIPPGNRSSRPWSHEGEEFIFVLDGSFTIEIEGFGTTVLNAGDAIVYPATQAHTWVGGAEESRIINVVALAA